MLEDRLEEMNQDEIEWIMMIKWIMRDLVEVCEEVHDDGVKATHVLAEGLLRL